MAVTRRLAARFHQQGGQLQQQRIAAATGLLWIVLDVRGNPYKAFHDIQLVAKGPIARNLKRFFRQMCGLPVDANRTRNVTVAEEAESA